MKCIYCKKQCIKKGKYKTIQRYQCKHCKKYQQQKYSRQTIPEYKYEWVKNLSNEGNGISSISRLLEITKSSVQRIIIRIASKIQILYIMSISKVMKWTNYILIVEVKSKNVNRQFFQNRSRAGNGSS
jgi:transposase-like protein